MSEATLTFLFTDIEGSSSKWEELPEQMSQALARHDDLVRNAVAMYGGRVIKSTGDGVLAAFEVSSDAVRAVVEMQLALLDPGATAGVGLRIRCGIHSGRAQLRDNDYYGGTVNRTARIMNAAHGGQILVSSVVAEDLRKECPPGVLLRDLGTVRLRGLSDSETVFQVVYDGLYQNFPALRELEATPNNLPHQLTSFVGRERERAEVEAMLGDTRLLTLLGMGGLGKTRLALQIGVGVLDSYPDGVWFVDLQTIRDDSLTASEIARVLGVREEPGRSLVDTLCGHLKSRKLMLILDNCEQVVETCAALSSAILRAAADVRIMATSRVALRAPGEQTYLVQPLPVPLRGDDLETVSSSTSVTLFVERAKLHKPSFALVDRDIAAVAELVLRLEGIPLAIELAAARVRALSIADINSRLKDRYKLLTGGDRTLQARQQTLRALVDWSYDLLEDNEQVLLGRLAVFAGAFDLGAVDAICSAPPMDACDLLDLTTSLVEKSLLRAEDGHGGVRYRMLETIRDYAEEKLLLRDEQVTTRAAHCAYFFAFAKDANDGLQGSDQAQWTTRVEAALDDLRRAIALALGGGVDPVIAIKLAVALMGFWILRGYSTEGRNLVRSALALPAIREHDLARAHALYVGAVLADAQSDYAEARWMLEECLALRRKLGNSVEIAATLSALSIVRAYTGDAEGARACEAESGELFRTQHHRLGEAISLLHFGQIEAYVKRDDDARRYLESCGRLAAEIAHHQTMSECEVLLGELSLDGGDSGNAAAHFERALDIGREAQDKRSCALALWWLGKIDMFTARLEPARLKLGESLQSFRTFGMMAEMLGCLEDAAKLFAATGSLHAASRVFGGVDALRARLALPRAPRREHEWISAVEQVRRALGSDAFSREWDTGHGWELDHALVFAQGQLSREQTATEHVPTAHS